MRLVLGSEANEVEYVTIISVDLMGVPIEVGIGSKFLINDREVWSHY